MGLFANLVARFHADTTEFEKGVKKAKGLLKGLEADVHGLKRAFQLAAVVGTAGFGVSVLKRHAIEAGEAIQAVDRLSKSLKVSTEMVQTMNFASRMSGASFEQINKAMTTFVRRIGEAKSGLGEGRDAIRAMGFDAKKMSKDPEAAFIKVLDTLAQMPNRASRAMVAFRLMGEGGIEAMNALTASGKTYSQWLAEARKAGVILSKEDVLRGTFARQAMTKLTVQVEVLWQKAVVAMAPYIEAFTESLGNLFAGGKPFAELLTTAFHTIGSIAIKTMQFFIKAGELLHILDSPEVEATKEYKRLHPEDRLFGTRKEAQPVQTKTLGGYPGFLPMPGGLGEPFEPLFQAHFDALLAKAKSLRNYDELMGSLDEYLKQYEYKVKLTLDNNNLAALGSAIKKWWASAGYLRAMVGLGPAAEEKDFGDPRKLARWDAVLTRFRDMTEASNELEGGMNRVAALSAMSAKAAELYPKDSEEFKALMVEGTAVWDAYADAVARAKAIVAKTEARGKVTTTISDLEQEIKLQKEFGKLAKDSGMMTFWKNAVAAGYSKETISDMMKLYADMTGEVNAFNDALAAEAKMMEDADRIAKSFGEELSKINEEQMAAADNFDEYLASMDREIEATGDLKQAWEHSREWARADTEAAKAWTRGTQRYIEKMVEAQGRWEELKKAQDRADMGKVMENSFGDAIDNMIWDMQRLEDAIKGILRAVMQEFMRIALVRPMANWMAGGMMSMMGMGAAGAGIPATTFTDWTPVRPRAHGGGDVGGYRIPRLHEGLYADEFPAILQRGEAVIPKGGGKSPSVDIRINYHGTGKLSVEKQDVQFDPQMNKVVVGAVVREMEANSAFARYMRRG